MNFTSIFTLLSLLSLSPFLLAGVLAQIPAGTTALPPTFFPLAVRSPYLNLWLITSDINGQKFQSPGGTWPSHWNSRVTGWAGLIRVDGTTFMWQGTEPDFGFAQTRATALTPTKSIFTLEAGPVRFNLTYFSPVEPSDWVRQSFPFSYCSIEVWSTDGQDHDVQLYSDTTGEWLTDNNSDQVSWKTQQTETTLIHSMQRVTQSAFTDRNDQPMDGTLYFTMPLNTPGMSFQTFTSRTGRVQFNATGTLNNSADQASTRPIGVGAEFPVLAIAVNLGRVREKTAPTTWSIGLVREPLIRAVKGGGVEVRSAYFWTRFNSITDAIDDWTNDFTASNTRAEAIDARLMSEGRIVSGNYADVAAFGFRQTFAGLDITVGRTANGAVNASDVKAYMKDIGNSGRVNAVETIYAALPSLLYWNSTLPKLLLEPLLEFQASSQYTNDYAAPDLGTTYPDVKGNATQQAPLGVENSGTMLVMALAHAQKSGDGSLLQRYYGLFKRWADYLAFNALQPTNAITSDGLTRATSNLALKGITGLYAMSAINRRLESVGASGNVTSTFSNLAVEQMKKWTDLAFNNDHVMGIYGDSNSWNLLYNAYAPKLLNTSLIDPKVMTAQATFYQRQAAAAPRFGLLFDSGTPGVSRADWLMFTAAAIPDPAVRDSLIDMVHTRAFWEGSGKPWPISWNPVDGITGLGRASPAQGSAFAILAQNMPDRPITVNAALGLGGAVGSTGASAQNMGPAIAGIVIGALVFIGLIAGFVWWHVRSRRRRARLEGQLESGVAPFERSKFVSGVNGSLPMQTGERSSFGPGATPYSFSNGGLTTAGGMNSAGMVSESTAGVASGSTSMASGVGVGVGAGASGGRVLGLASTMQSSRPMTKAQEAAMESRRNRMNGGMVGLDDDATHAQQYHQVGKVFMAPPPSSTGSGSGSGGDGSMSPTATVSMIGSTYTASNPDALRTEVDQLRREMAELRQAQELPPSYDYQSR